MTKSGVYKEPLPCGGDLCVEPARWKIQYYFKGPDLRYSGTFVEIPGDKVEAYIQGYLEAWDEFIRLKELVPAGGEFEKDGKLGMSIRIGKYHEGVCINSYHMPIATKDHLDRVIEGYRYAIGRAGAIQTLLSSLS